MNRKPEGYNAMLISIIQDFICSKVSLRQQKPKISYQQVLVDVIFSMRISKEKILWYVILQIKQPI
jgi:hypothetical protein